MKQTNYSKVKIIKLTEDKTSDMILEVANLYNEVTTSDLQGIAQAKARDIIKQFGKKGTIKEGGI